MALPHGISAGPGIPAGIVVPLLTVLSLFGCGGESESLGERTLELEPCHLSMPGSTARHAAECGILAVPEDPDDPSGRTLDLRVAVVPAVSRSPAPDPLFLLAGGPGQAATEAFITMLPALERIGHERDLVMVDQRGTGRLRTLECPEEDLDPAIEADEEMLRQWIVECREALEADPRLFTTEISMADLDAVREALGYEQVNLYGGSYGTRAALVYLRLFPERVRTVILDGVVPWQMAVGAEMGVDAQRALDLMLARCEDDEACRDRFPTLRTRFMALLDRLAAEPILVELPHPTTGEPTEVLLTHEVVAGTIRLLTYSPEATSLVPLIVDAAHEHGDLVPLAAQSLIGGQQASDSISSVLMLSVLCAEDIPFFPDEAPEVESFLGSALSDRFSALCEEWPAAEIPAEFKQPTPSDVPVLLLSGEGDPVTPPRWGELAGESLENSVHVIAPGMAHIVMARGCIPKLAEQFVESADPAGLELDCVEELRAPPFFTSFTGTEP